ncbi:methyl-accepting chemotaxis protein [Moritella marina ATCC 15381]|uniref:Methyl-accepting chemotaxis protein n=1 Tax=Moritella marina ATCC 15381 TaxID=1202962 RepID=A0A5J6WGX9_MORMI|nr:methyl-accepting chemotaxis protein [Moritella marina]QFI37329.1 methyl-accepting chemotaxis protein [Moritella marina ATCC 15381]
MHFLSSFKGRIITVVMLLVISSLVIASFISYRQLSTSIVGNIDKYSHLQVDSTADKVNSWFQSIKKGLVTTAPYFAVPRDEAQLLLMVKQLSLATDANDILAAYEDGTAITAIDGKLSLESYDPRVRDWYKDAKQKGETIITGIYSDATTGGLMISIAEPFYYNSQFTGVLLADIRLETVSNFIQNSTFENTTLNLYDMTGMTIASTDNRQVVGKPLDSANAAFTPFKNTLSNNQKGTFEFNQGQITTLAYFTTLNLDDSISWKVAITVDKSSHFIEIAESLDSAFITGLILVILASIIILMALNRLYQPILSLKETIVDLAEGNADLTRRIKIYSNDDLGQIAQAVNKFTANLQSMMLEISQSTEHISAGINALRSQTEHNNNVLLDHASETEQIVVAITEMSSTADSVAQSAAQSATFTQKSTDEAKRSKTVVQGAVYGVAELVTEVDAMAVSIQTMNEDTNKISSVLSVIGEIADQTNLLALNAAIEAARAGEQGRGFAVVADEVRTLAARTQQSTSEINDMLTRLRHGADSAVKAMHTTKSSCEQTAETTESVNDSLDSMTESVLQINDLGIQIATAAEEQSSVTEEINRNMTSIQTMVYQLTSNSDKTLNSSHELANNNAHLMAIVSKFKLK